MSVAAMEEGGGCGQEGDIVPGRRIRRERENRDGQELKELCSLDSGIEV